MSIRLTAAITDGIRRGLTRTGVILGVGLLVYLSTYMAALNTLLAATVPPEAVDGIGLTLPVPEWAAAILLLACYLFMGGFSVVLARALTRPVSDLSTFPRELYTRRIGRATLWMIIGGTVVFVTTMLGLLLLILPGLFLAASFFFFVFTVGVEDRGTVGGLRRSWDLSRGNRLRLIALVVLIGVLGGVIGAVGAFFEAAGEPVMADVGSIVVNSVLFVFIYGIMAAAYLQVDETDRDAASGKGIETERDATDHSGRGGSSNEPVRAVGSGGHRQRDP